MTVDIYGIKNCDTMKKAFRWLEENKIGYTFHDYKKFGANKTLLKEAIKQHGWENVINRRGTSWRSLPDAIKESMNEVSAIEAAMNNPSLIRRPMLALGNDIYLGFDEAAYETLFGRS